MGGAVSCGQDNDELVDNLMGSGYIRTKKVEQVFRAVDRANYVLPEYREGAYKDLAWKHENIHLSAPCIYSEVLEGLSLEPGLSFLNLGSGTGYLSTMAGLLIKQHGINHGIELHEDCLSYAYKRLEEFKETSLALNEFDFCEPVFTQGNCLSLIPGRQYDRVYCGAACPESHEAFIKQFVRVGGILVMPYKDELLRLQRVDENTWLQNTMLPVSFATLVVPPSSEHNLFHLPEYNPLSLQELCRGRIRHHLRHNIWNEHPELETVKPVHPPIRQGQTTEQQDTLRRFVIPIFDSDDFTDDEEELAGRARFLLNARLADVQPGEAITTSLQLVRAVVQPNQNGEDSRESQRILDNTYESTRDIGVNTDFPVRQQRRKSNAKSTVSSMSMDDTSAGHSSSVGTDTNDNNNGVEERSKRNVEKSSVAAYSNMSDSDSDSDDEQESVFMQRKKIAKREKTDSGIVDDANFSNDESSSSSNTNHSDTNDSDITDTTDAGDAMDVDPELPEIAIYKSCNDVCCNPKWQVGSNGKKVTVAHYTDSKAFAVYMKEKIGQLPLPFSIKLYMNYNRKL